MIAGNASMQTKRRPISFWISVVFAALAAVPATRAYRYDVQTFNNLNTKLTIAPDIALAVLCLVVSVASLSFMVFRRSNGIGAPFKVLVAATILIALEWMTVGPVQGLLGCRNIEHWARAELNSGRYDKAAGPVTFYSVLPQYPVTPPPNGIPKFILDTRPYSIQVTHEPDDAKRTAFPCVVVDWGGGNGHWGVVVSQEPIRELTRQATMYHQLRQNVYVYTEN